AIVKLVEDRINVVRDTGELGVQLIIVIEDNILFASSFLPVMYSELMSHALRLVPEGINLAHKVMRLQARPKILLCRTFEEAWRYFDRYEENVLGVISDIEFPKGGVLSREAGVEFARRVRARQQGLPRRTQSFLEVVEGPHRVRRRAQSAAAQSVGLPDCRASAAGHHPVHSDVSREAPPRRRRRLRPRHVRPRGQLLADRRR